jgi:hypothetical protein
MANPDLDVDLSGISDWQRPVALAVGLVLVLVGAVALTGVSEQLGLDYLGDDLVLGVFGIPVWLGLTVVVAGLLGILFSRYAGGGTTFDKVAAGLVLPAVLFLAVTDWALAVGSLPVLALGVVTLLLAVVVAAVGTILLWGHPLALVFPVVALLAVVDWAVSLTAIAPVGAAVNLPTIGLLIALAVVLGAIAFEGGRRLTGRTPTA